jgi:hypothetical protein
VTSVPDAAQASVEMVKRWATLQARAALAGFELVQLGDGSLIASKPAWGMFTNLADVAAAEAWLIRVGAPA